MCTVDKYRSSETNRKTVTIIQVRDDVVWTSIAVDSSEGGKLRSGQVLDTF